MVRRSTLLLGTTLLPAILPLLLTGCGNWVSSSVRNPVPVIAPELMERSSVPSPAARACGECHKDIFDQWLNSHHARANRLIHSSLDLPAFENPRTYSHGSFSTRVSVMGPHMTIEQGPKDMTNEQVSAHRPEAVIGYEPLVQYLAPFPGGRLQVVDMAYHPGSNEWFNVFGEENRQPHEWGFWKNRGNNWNSQCAFCHMTGFAKNYAPQTDSYRSSWAAMGISCAQCHGPMEGHVANPSAPTSSQEVKTTQQVMDNCASCHSRRTELTGTFQPGDRFDDHFSLMLAHQPEIYHPDGQVLGENFTYGSFMMSRMAHRGITCLDCHNPHSAELTIPVRNNLLCLSCHQAPGQREAKLIDPATHSKHPPGSSGDACIACHMPVTTYMQRDPRRDHSFSSPDPVMTREFGIPNACTQCHENEAVEWAVEWKEKWWPDVTQTTGRARQRTRTIARVQAGEPEAVDELLALIATEDIDFRRATLVTLLSPWANHTNVRNLLRKTLSDTNAWVRTAAVHALAPLQEAHEAIVPLRKDSSRLVRIAASRATLGPNHQSSPGYQEVIAYLNNVSDQPPGAVEQAELALAEGRNADAEQWMHKALAWDPSAQVHYLMGRTHYALGKLSDAENSMTEAIRLNPENAEYSYSLALLYAETGRSREALQSLVKTVKIAPRFGRAWYNLGLAYAQEEHLDKGIHALRKAESLMPNLPDPIYARATLHFRKQEWDEVRSAAEQVLRIDPGHSQANAILGKLPAFPGTK